MPSVIRDLPNGNEPYEVRPPEYEYPFLNQGDPWSFIVTRAYKQTITGYNADRLASKYLPGVERDRVHNEAYMVNESIPARTSTAMVAFTRSFARVPRQQVIPSSMYVTKPPITGTLPQNIGASVVIQPDTTVAQYNIYDRLTVLSDSGAPTIGYATGGTYTITVGGATTGAIAYNAVAATVQTALNLLTPVSSRGNATVTGTYNSAGGFTISLPTWPAAAVDYALITHTGTALVGSAGGMNTERNFLQVAFNTAFGTGVITGGTFTVTVLGDTSSAIAYNASTATVSTVINGLTNVANTATVTVPATGGYSKPLANDSTNIWFYVLLGLPTSTSTATLTPTGCTSTITAASATSWTLTFSTGGNVTRSIVATTAHGITTADDIYVKIGTAYLEIDSGSFSVFSTTGISFTAASGSVFANTDAITEFGRRNSTYAAGAKLTRIKRVTDFYLPMVTAGIATADDIPLPTYQGDPATLLEAIFANETDINYEVGELGRWRDTPILSRTTTTINAATL